MKRLKSLGFVLILAVIAIALLTATAFGAREVAFAAESEETVTPTEPTEEGDNALQALAEKFIAELKEKYGEDYETYYNAILEEWGSIEEYLFSLIPENAPDAAADGWKAFVAWLGEYSPVWGSVLAVGLVIVVIVFGKKALGKIAEWVTSAGKKFKAVFASVNKLYQSNIATGEAMIKLLGENPKFSETKAEIQKAIDEMKKEEEV